MTPRRTLTKLERKCRLIAAALLLNFSLILFVACLFWSHTSVMPHTISSASVLSFLAGFFVTFWVGGLIAYLFVAGIRDIYMGIPSELPEFGTRRFPPWLSGLLEKLVIFFVAYFMLLQGGKPSVTELLTVSAAWIGLRLATNWSARLNRAINEANHQRASGGAQIAFWAMVISIAFAILGAFIAAEKFPGP